MADAKVISGGRFPLGSLSKIGLRGGTTKLPAKFGSVLFRQNLTEVITIQGEAAEESALAAAKVVRGYIKKVQLANGFKGTRTGKPLEFLDDISVELVASNEQNQEFEARVGLKEKDAPDRPYTVFWEFGHWNEYTDSWERNAWIAESMRDTRAVQANAAVSAAQDQIPIGRQIRGFFRGFSVFSVVGALT